MGILYEFYWWNHTLIYNPRFFFFFFFAIQTVGKGRSLLLQAKVKYSHSNHVNLHSFYFFHIQFITCYKYLSAMFLGGFYRLRLWEQASRPHPFSPGLVEGSSASVTPGRSYNGSSYAHGFLQQVLSHSNQLFVIPVNRLLCFSFLKDLEKYACLSSSSHSGWYEAASLCIQYRDRGCSYWLSTESGSRWK